MYSTRRIIPLVFNMLAGISATASTIYLLVVFRQLTLLFGSHAVSASTIAFSMLVCMALGSYFTGFLADKSSRRLYIFAAFAALAGIYVLFQPILFRLMGNLINTIIPVFYPGPFGIELLRLLFSFLFLLFPAGTMAGLYNLLIRHFIRHSDQSGKFMNAIITSGGVGIVAGISAATFWLIPGYGFRLTGMAAGFLLLINALITLLLLIRKGVKAQVVQIPALIRRVKNTTLRFRKKKAVLEAQIKLKRATIRVFAFQGFTAAAYLLICLRILSYYAEIRPVFLSSLLLLILFMGLALGGILYRHIAERPANSYLTMATIQIVTGFSAVLSYVFLYLLHPAIISSSGEAASFTRQLLKHTFLFSSLVLLPAIVMGLSLPLAGKLYSRQLRDTGRKFGRLGLTWCFGFLAGTLVARYFLIPLSGFYYSYFIVVLLFLLSGTYLIIRDSRLIRGFRLGYTFLSIILYLLIIAAFETFHVALPLSGSTDALKPVRRIEGSTASLNTLEHADGSLAVRLNNQTMITSDQAGRKVEQLPAFLPMMLNDSIRTSLVIGFGMGTTASVLDAGGIGAIHIAEVFPEMVRFSSDVFADINDDVMTNSNVTITIEDARTYLMRTAGKTDLITSGYPQMAYLPNYYTTEFYRLCYQKLSGNGLITQVLPLDEITADEFRSVLKSFAAAFPEISLWYLTTDRILLLGSKTSRSFTFCQFYDRFSRINSNDDLVSLGIPDPESLIAHFFLGDRQCREYAAGVPENTDDKPLVQFSRKTSRIADAELLHFLATEKADENSLFRGGEDCREKYRETIEKAAPINALLRKQLAPSSGKP